jgi:hypothetical protein
MGENSNMGIERRKDVRYQTIAKAKIEGMNEGETLLKDISITGCNVECTAYADIEPNTRYKLEIIPENAARIGIFDLTVESRWIRAGGYSCEIGFSIVESPKGKQFERYVDYLSWRYSQGNSLTGSGAPDNPAEE